MRPERVFVFHGYLSYPEEAWLPWFKAELERAGCAVTVPRMPHADAPVIAEWVAFVAKTVGEPDARTALVGHSMGVQAVIRYLETLGATGKSVARTVLVAGGYPPAWSEAEAEARIGDRILRPWFTTAADPKMVKAAAGQCTVILSRDDPYIDVPSAIASFQATLDPKIILEDGKGHYNEDTDVIELPAAIDAVLR
jgi:predicted alpha/beta hydrolase family esterase